MAQPTANATGAGRGDDAADVPWRVRLLAPLRCPLWIRRPRPWEAWASWCVDVAATDGVSARVLRDRRRGGPRPAGRRSPARRRPARPGVRPGAAPADAVVLKHAARAVVGDRAVLEADAAPGAEAPVEVRAQLGGAAVRVRFDGLAKVPVGGEGADDRVGITGVQRGEVAADDVSRPRVRGREDRRPDVAAVVDRQLAAVGAEHHRPVVRGLGDDRHRPRRLAAAFGQVSEQFEHGPAVDAGGGHSLDPGPPVGKPHLVAVDELPELPVTADLTGVRVVDHHLAGPGVAQRVQVAVVERVEVDADGIGFAFGAGLPARQLHGADEVGEPGHLSPRHPGRATAGPATCRRARGGPRTGSRCGCCARSARVGARACAGTASEHDPGNDVSTHAEDLSGDELLAAVDVEVAPGERRVGHEVHGERGDVGRADDPADRQRRAQLGRGAPRAGRRAATPTAGCRRSRRR